MSDSAHGSIQAYARGIEIIHWLFNERIQASNQHSWQQIVPIAPVKVVKHDHVNQLITLEASDPVTEIPAISSQRKDPNEIKDQMEGSGQYAPGVGLENVGLSLAEAKQASTTSFGARTKCDTCQFTRSGCKLMQGKVCVQCLKLFGRPFCSWTPGIPSHSASKSNPGNSFDALESSGDLVNIARRKALFGLKGWSGDAIVSADPVMIAVDEGDEFDEMSDADFDAAGTGTEEREWFGP